MLIQSVTDLFKWILSLPEDLDLTRPILFQVTDKNGITELMPGELTLVEDSIVLNLGNVADGPSMIPVMALAVTVGSATVDAIVSVNSNQSLSTEEGDKRIALAARTALSTALQSKRG